LPLLGDDGRPLSTADFLDQLRIHPVYGFLFQQRGAMGAGAMGTGTAAMTGSANGAFGELALLPGLLEPAIYRHRGGGQQHQPGPQSRQCSP
jgi:hypothetical protein